MEKIKNIIKNTLQNHSKKTLAIATSVILFVLIKRFYKKKL